MSPLSKTEIWLYRLLAASALAATWTFNIKHMLAGYSLLDFVRHGYASNALAAVSTDIFLCGTMLFPWMIREARRHRIKHLWGYLFFSVTIAISVTFPLFLAARRRAIDNGVEKRGATKLTALYPVMAAIALVLCNLFTVRFFFYEGVTVTAFIQGWFANAAGSSLAFDLIFLGAELMTFLVAEARRGHVRSVALYIAMSVFGLAFALPWLLRDVDMHGHPYERKDVPA